MNLQAQGQAADFKQFNLSEYRLQISRQNQPLLTASGSGTYDLADASADAQVTLQASLAGLGDAFPQPGRQCFVRHLQLKGRSRKNRTHRQSPAGLCSPISRGRSDNNAFHNFGSTLDMDVSRTPEQIQINKAHRHIDPRRKCRRQFDLAGSYDPAQTNPRN